MILQFTPNPYAHQALLNMAVRNARGRRVGGGGGGSLGPKDSPGIYGLRYKNESNWEIRTFCACGMVYEGGMHSAATILGHPCPHCGETKQFTKRICRSVVDLVETVTKHRFFFWSWNETEVSEVQCWEFKDGVVP